MSFGNKILRRYRFAGSVLRIDNNQLEFHFFRKDTLYVHTGGLAHADPFPRFCQSGKVRGKLHKNAVFLHRSHHTGHRFPLRKQSGIFLPGTEQFTVGQADPSVLK